MQGWITQNIELIVFAIVFVAVFGIAYPLRRRFPPGKRFGSLPRQVLPFDAGQQLHAVMASSFEKRRLLSPTEYRVFKVIEDDVASAGKGHRVFAQTSLGEILASASEDAYRAINSKRVDVLIVDQAGWPVAAVEYQGSGHYQGTAAARDAIKKEALRRAGVRYVEISETDSPDQIRYRVREQLGWGVTLPG